MGCLRQPAADPASLENLDTLASSGAKGDFLRRFKAAYNPFVSHAFFAAAEASGSACARTGWGPRHLLAKVGGRIVGIVPCYLKSHSQGEYVFDRGWAEAYMRAGGSYYPKLQVSVPFTPATGPRLLIRDGVDRDRIGSALASGLMALCNATDASSVHVTFAREAEAKFLGAHGFLQRTDQQFHWHNDGFKTFDDFLATLNSRHRKAIKRERREARRRRHQHPLADRQGHHRRGLGRLLRVLHGDRFAQMGTALSRRANSSR